MKLIKLKQPVQFHNLPRYSFEGVSELKEGVQYTTLICNDAPDSIKKYSLADESGNNICNFSDFNSHLSDLVYRAEIAKQIDDEDVKRDLLDRFTPAYNRFIENRKYIKNGAAEFAAEFKDWCDKYNIRNITSGHYNHTTHKVDFLSAIHTNGNILTFDEIAAENNTTANALAQELLFMQRQYAKGESEMDKEMLFSVCDKYLDQMEHLDNQMKTEPVVEKKPRERKVKTAEAPAKELMDRKAERNFATALFAATGVEVLFPAGITDNGINTADVPNNGLQFSFIVRNGKVYVPQCMFNLNFDNIHNSKDFRKFSNSTAARTTWHDAVTGDEITFDKELKFLTRRPLEVHEKLDFDILSARRLSDLKEQLRKEEVQALTTKGIEAYNKLRLVTRNHYNRIKTAISVTTSKTLADMRKANTEKHRVKKDITEVNNKLFDVLGIKEKDLDKLSLTSQACLAHITSNGGKQHITVIDHAANSVFGSFDYDYKTGVVSNHEGCFTECKTIGDCTDRIEGIVLFPSNIEAIRAASLNNIIAHEKAGNPTLFNGWETLERYEDNKGKEYFMVYKPGDKNIPEGAYVTNNIEALKNKLGANAEIMHGADMIEAFKQKTAEDRQATFESNLGTPVPVDTMEKSLYMIRTYSKNPWSLEQSIAVRPIESFIGTYQALDAYESIRGQISDDLKHTLSPDNIKETITSALKELLQTADGGQVSDELIHDALKKVIGDGKDLLETHLGGNALYVKEPNSDSSLSLVKTPDGTLSFRGEDGKKSRVIADNGDNDLDPDAKTLREVITTFQSRSTEKLKDIQSQVTNVLLQTDGISMREIITEEHTENSGFKKSID